MKSHYRRIWLAGLLCIYVVLLASASAPRFIRIGPIIGIQSFSQKTLGLLGVSPGLELFYRPYAETKKVDSECLRVIVHGLNIETEITSHPLNCIWSKGLVVDPFEVMFQRVMEELVTAHALKNTDRESYLISGLARQFCSTRKAISSDRTANIQWFQNKIDYANDEKTRVLQFYLDWDCSSNSLTRNFWYPNIPRGLGDGL